VLIPIRDHNPRTRYPAGTLLLVAANVAVFLFELALDGRGRNLLIQSAGAIPYEIVNHVDIRPRNLLPVPGSIWTSMFLHADIWHLVGNMWFLWLFGDNVEDALGTLRYAFFYLLVGTVGALAQVLTRPDSMAPMIGASGAVAGVLGAYMLLYPRARVVTFVAIPFLWHLRELPAWVFLGVWFIGQFLIPGNSGIAWMAHVGGFLAGVGTIRLLARRPHPSELERAVDAEYLPPPSYRRGWPPGP
jgi:membrane associated rhomboid family serine protease